MAVDDLNPEQLEIYNQALEKSNELLAKRVETQKEIEQSLTGQTVDLEKQFISIQQIVKLRDDEKKKQELISQALDAQLGKKSEMLLQEERAAEIKKIELAVEKERKRLIDEDLQAAQKKIDLAKAFQEELAKHAEGSKEYERIQKDIKRELGAEKKNLEDIIIASREVVATKKAEGEQIDVNIESLGRQAAAQDEVASSVRASANEADELLRKFFGISQQTQSFIGQLNIGKDGLKRFVSGFFDARKQFDALAAKAEEYALGLGRQLMGMVFSVDQAMVDLTRSTAQFDRNFEDEVTNIVAAGEALGVTYEESAGALSQLFESSKGFVSLSKAQQIEAGKQATQFAKLGVSTQAYGSILDTVTKTFRQSVGETNTLTMRFVNLSRVLGRLPTDVIDDFNQSLSTLARSGPAAVGQFEKLAMIARQTGVEVNTLLGITRQFETFGSASEAVGTLNAMLGGPFLNTMEMVNASFDDPAKTIELLSNAINRSGQSFASMDAAMKQAIASQAGISDMSIAERLFGGEITYQQLQKEMADTSVSFEELGEKARTNLSISETLNMILQDTFRQMQEDGTDIGELFKNMARILRQVIEFINEWGGSFAFQAGLVAFALAPVISAIGNLIGLLVGGAGKGIGAIKGMEKLGITAARAGAIALRTMGIAGGLMGLGMAAAGEGAGSAAGGAASGAMLGASIGSMFAPVAGTVIGAAIGGIGGGLVGYFADGTDSAPAGMALVGERGPELVQMRGGERVFSNSETVRMLNTNNASSSVERMTAVNSATQRIIANNMSAQRVSTEKSTEIMEKLADGTNINVTGKAPVVLKLDNRELAKSMVDIIGDNIRPRSTI